MAENSWPFYGIDTTEAQFSKWASTFAENGVISGLAVTAGAGMTINVAIGQAIIQGFYYENTAIKNLAVGASGATQRKDYLVLKLDIAAKTITLVVKAGGAALPALTQTAAVWEHPLSEITVPAAAVNLVAGNIAQRLAGTGLRVIPYVEGQRPTPVTSRALGINTTSRIMEFWDGANWYALTPELAWANITGKPATFTPSAHTHSFGSLTDVPATFPPDLHDHDDRYYTESEIDTKVNNLNTAIDAAELTAAWATVTGKPTSFTPAAHNQSASTITSGTIARTVDTSGSVRADDFIACGDTYGRTLSTSYRSVYTTADGGYYGYVASTREVKNLLGVYVPNFDEWMKLDPQWYAYKADEGQSARLGLLAEDLNEFAPELVDHTDGKPDGVKYEVLAVALLGIVQQLNARIVELEARAGIEYTAPDPSKPKPATKANLAQAKKLAQAERDAIAARRAAEAEEDARAIAELEAAGLEERAAE